MAPKGSNKLPKDIGHVVQHSDGWRVHTVLAGKNASGPTRHSKKQATSDLAVAQQTATQEEMGFFLHQLRAACQVEGQSLTADTLWQRLQQTRLTADVSTASTALPPIL